MSVNYNEYYVQLVNKRTKSAINDDTGKFIVTQAGTATVQTIYTDDSGTVPAFVPSNISSTMTDGIIQFWTDADITSVDISVLTENGQAAFIEGLTQSQHRIEIDTEKYEQTLVLPYYTYIPTPFVSASVTCTGSVWSQGMSLPAGSLVKSCYVRVETLGTGSLVNVGISAHPSGFLQDVTGSVTGLKWASALIATAGTASFAKGNLLYNSLFIVPSELFRTVASVLVFQRNTVTVLAAEIGYVYIQYDLLPNRV